MPGGRQPRLTLASRRRGPPRRKRMPILLVFERHTQGHRFIVRENFFKPSKFTTSLDEFLSPFSSRCLLSTPTFATASRFVYVAWESGLIWERLNLIESEEHLSM